LQPKIKLSRLRDIGWSHWDPIGLLAKGDEWDHKPFADEYDSYLMQAASRLRRNEPVAEVVDYLVWVESERMGLGTRSDQREKIEALVAAIKDDEELWTSG